MSAAHIDQTQRWESLPLSGDGRSAITASAGTGKTYTIGMLYLRALLTLNLLPRQILVTTFTRAAAAEISGRVRAVLEDAFDYASGRTIAHEGVQSWLTTRWSEDNTTSPATDAQILARAISGFDQAAIGTLHSICQRILSDHPFAVRAGFIAPDLIQGGPFYDEIARDIWRHMISPQDQSGLREAYLASGLKYTLKSFSKAFRGCVHDAHALEATDTRLFEVFESNPARRHWSSAEAAAFCELAALTKRTKATMSIVAFLAHYESCGDDLSKMTWDDSFENALIEPWKYNKGKAASESEIEAFKRFIHSGVRGLREKHRAAVLAFWQNVFALETQLSERRMAASHTLTFDAVLTRVRDALDTEANTRADARPLADALFDAWPMAMVDEFQDTNGVQFDILDRIYSHADGTPRGRLMMIGDPKQSIYRFRGADINVFTRATEGDAAPDKLILGKNFRSSGPYVQAINYLYEHTIRHLGPGTSITYEAVEASDRCDNMPFTVAGRAATPLTIWAKGFDKNAQKNDGNEVESDAESAEFDALETCAQQIATLLSDPSAKIGDARLKPADIAVLLTSNNDVQTLVQALRAHGVPAVSKSSSSVFASETAYELQVLLHAVLHAGDPAIRRAAAATSLWGASYETVLAWSMQEGLDADMADTLNTWHTAWRQNGPLHLVAQIIAHTAPHQLTAQSGERVLTDLRHLGECLQDNTVTGDSMASQLAWFVRQIEDSDDDRDEDSIESNALRMESDEARVQVMTQHASKGLEFPIVFLPTASKGPAHDTSPFVYTDAAGVRRLTPFDDAKAARNSARDEERRRLLYVSLTRAIHACHVYAAPSRQPAAILEILNGFGDVLSDPQARDAGVVRMPHWPQCDPSVHYRGEDAHVQQRTARATPERPKHALPEHHSFTTLTRSGKHAHAQEVSAADDEHNAVGVLTQLPDAVDEIAHLDGVKGAEIGNALHAVMEHRDFDLPLAAQLDLIANQIAACGVPMVKDKKALTLASAEMLDRAMHASLQLAQRSDFTLAHLRPESTRAELEFHFELSGFQFGTLGKVLAAHGLGDILPDRHFEVRGLLNGKIDLVFDAGGRFHVLDYKSNALGATDAEYSGHALIAHMDKHYYRFQALIYVVALDRYLASRLPHYARATHLGEAVYLFLRAARPGSTAGVWSYRFDDALIEAVQRVLGGMQDE